MTLLPDETLSCLFAAYLDEAAKTRELLRSSLRTWGPNLRCYVRWFESEYGRPPVIDDWHEMPIILYSAWLQTKPNRNTGRTGLRPRTVVSHLDALHAVGKWFVARKIATFNPVEHVERPRLDQAQRKFIEPEEVKLLKNSVDKLYPLRYRKLVKAVLSVFFCTGLRYEDVRGLKMRNIVLSDIPGQSKIIVEHSKGDKEFVIHIPRETVNALRDWIAERATIDLNADNDWLWVITKSRRIGDHWWAEMRQNLQTVAQLDLEGRLQAHAMRRAFATHLDDQNISIHIIQKLLDHNRPETTSLYIRQSKERVQKVVEFQGWDDPEPESQPDTAPNSEIRIAETETPIHAVVTAQEPAAAAPAIDPNQVAAIAAAVAVALAANKPS